MSYKRIKMVDMIYFLLAKLKALCNESTANCAKSMNSARFERSNGANGVTARKEKKVVFFMLVPQHLLNVQVNIYM